MSPVYIFSTVFSITSRTADTEKELNKDLSNQLERPSLESAEGSGTPLQYSCLENPMGGGVWQAAVRRVAKSLTRLSDLTFTFHFPALEKEMATHSCILAWKIPWVEESGSLQSMGSQRVGHD